MTEAKKKHIEKRDVKKQFWFELTEKETREMSKQAGNLHAEIGKDDLAFTEVKKAWKAKIGKKQTELGTMLAVLKTGKEQREVEAQEIKDFDKREIRWVVDGKVIESREMKPEETQQSFALDASKKRKQDLADAKKTISAESKLRKEAEEFQSKRKKKPAPTTGNEIADVIKSETSRKTKHSAVDGAVDTVNA